MRSVKYFFVSSLLLAVGAVAAGAQETQTKVVDEVVAMVNNDVITLSQVRRETKSAVDSFVQQGKTREEAQKLVDEKMGELISNLINEALLIQRAKELNMDNDIEAALNQRFVDVMKQYNLKSLEQLYAEMEKQNVDPKVLKEEWRKQITRDNVLQRDVQSKVYWGISAAELKAYYEKNKDKFTTPAKVSFSELFLSFAGRDESAVKANAKKLLADLRAGADFTAMVKEHGDPGPVTQTTRKIENAQVSELPEGVSKPLAGVPAGGYTEPFDAEGLGIVILKVDARTEASKDSVFDERKVRLAMMPDRVPPEQKKYLSKLRDDAVIKLSESYRPIVSPVLFADERKDKPAVGETTPASTTQKVDGGKADPKSSKAKSNASKGKPDRKDN